MSEASAKLAGRRGRTSKHPAGLTLGDLFYQRQEPGCAGLPVMSVTMNDNLVLRDDLERRTESTLAPEQHLLVRKGDIAYNMMRMWQGACGLATADGIVSPAYVVLAPKKEIDSRFAYHWFKTARMIHLFWAYSHGLTEDRLRLYFDAFSLIPAAVPSLSVQRRVAAILDSFDRSIECTKSLISAQSRRRLYVSRFLFRDLQKVRGHHIMHRLADIVGGNDCIIGGPFGSDLTQSDYVEAGVPVIRGTNMQHDDRWVGGDFVFVTPEKAFSLRRNSGSPGDIVVTQRGSLGQVSIIPASLGFERYIVSQSQMLIKSPSDKVLGDYIYHYLTSEFFEKTLKSETIQTGLPHINLSILRNANIILPSTESQRKIVRTLDDFDRAIGLYRANIVALSRLKQGLMQKLFFDDRWVDERVNNSTPLEFPMLR